MELYINNAVVVIVRYDFVVHKIIVSVVCDLYLFMRWVHSKTCRMHLRCQKAQVYKVVRLIPTLSGHVMLFSVFKITIYYLSVLQGKHNCTSTRCMRPIVHVCLQ